ncbi:phage tail family protein [Priestia megaterium]|jgi:phage-related protein|uniref:phage tail family protein n=1 Tax=Priestia megaterium TaxID=1404 RepID=UPI0021BE2DDB|nr:phage tail family protein [Priestia megaterium]MCT9852839.1 phage tail family protein [Priestia megaterium]MDF1962501.1 phage tail family protein [Priestia megaterium]
MIRMFDEQMNEVDLSKYGLMAKSFRPSSLPPEHVTDNVPGRPGLIRSGTELGARKCEADFRVKGSSFYTHSLFKSNLFDLFDPTKQYYVVQEEQVGKRWHVVVSSEWTPERINPSVSKFTVPFETYDLPYAESINTSLTPQTFDTPWWQLGMGLIAEDTPYTFTTSSFRVHNPGNVIVNPFYCEMEITIQAICSNYIELVNETTGDKWRYDGALTSSDTVKLGFKAKKNNLSIYRLTNREIITLMPGWNKFKVNGASSIQNITFAFRFYYKG